MRLRSYRLSKEERVGRLTLDVAVTAAWWWSQGVQTLYIGEERSLVRLQEKDDEVRVVRCEDWARSIVMEPHIVARWMEALAGRLLTTEELVRWSRGAKLPMGHMTWQAIIQWGVYQGEIQLHPGVEVVRSWWRPLFARCLRCGGDVRRMKPIHCVHCQGFCLYCTRCVDHSSMRPCTVVIHGVRSISRSVNGTSKRQTWSLTRGQQQAVAQAQDFVRSEQNKFLLWAVTGAGKTEMVYPLISEAVCQGQSVLIATPRRDVVCELLPRIRRAFPQERIVALYGGSSDIFSPLGSITLATTHQLVRVRAAFDRVIVDEIDAFPYAGNEALVYAVERVGRTDAKTIWLTATPPPSLRRAMRKGKLPYAVVCERFHGHPLPVPQEMRLPAMRLWREQARLPVAVERRIARSRERGARLLLFVPVVQDVAPLVALLRQQGFSVLGTYAADAERQATVEQFRSGGIDILVTTTILERGVTIAHTDVIVLDAHASQWDATALIQISGRAGRSGDAPHGEVTLCRAYRTRQIAEAIRDIRQMNARAQRDRQNDLLSR